MPDLSVAATDESPITEEMRLEARRRHEDVVHHGARTLEHMQALGQALADMRDRRLYLAMGHSSFEAYCTHALGVSRDWADRRIQIGEFIEQNAAALRQIPNLSQTSLRILAKLPAPEQAEFIQTQPVQDMSTRELEEAVRQARHQADEAKIRAEAAEQEAEALRQRPPRVEYVDNPALVDEVTRLREALAAKDRTVDEERQAHARARELYTRTLEELRQLQERTAYGVALEERVTGLKQQLRDLAELAQSVGAQFDDGERDPNGGLKLLEAIHPIERVMYGVLGNVRTVAKRGAGGFCKDDDVKRLADQLRELARMLDGVLKDRANRPILADFREVE